jgi:hypothetical protein
MFCSGLTTISLGDGLEEIGAGAFGNCTSLEEIVIPKAVKAMEDGAYSECSTLTTVTLGNGLEKNRAEALSNCTSLQEIVTPNAVKTIKKGHTVVDWGC